jgi:hypothetical protein
MTKHQAYKCILYNLIQNSPYETQQKGQKIDSLDRIIWIDAMNIENNLHMHGPIKVL